MNILQILNGVKSGTLDARAEVINMINRMSPAQRKQIERMLPQVERVARQSGIDIGNFKDEVSAHLI